MDDVRAESFTVQRALGPGVSRKIKLDVSRIISSILPSSLSSEKDCNQERALAHYPN